MAATKDPLSLPECRFSARLQYSQQKPFYGTTTTDQPPVVVSKKAKPQQKKTVTFLLPKVDDDENAEEEEEVSKSDGEAESQGDGDCEGEKESVDEKKGDMSVYVDCGARVDDKGKSYVARLKETLRRFNVHYLHYLQNESETGDDKKAVSENGRGSLGVLKKQSKRPDLKAISQMLINKEIRYTEKTVGHLPGIEVGQQFYSRSEMVVAGFHSHWLNGIDLIGESKGKAKYKGYTLPIAVAIVLSGQYEDDVDNSDAIVYTGQGGNDLLGNKRQIKDQVMRSGNLALKNNMEQFIPVRVIRGHKCDNSYTKKVYTYDGWYQVRFSQGSPLLGREGCGWVYRF